MGFFLAIFSETALQKVFGMPIATVACSEGRWFSDRELLPSNIHIEGN